MKIQPAKVGIIGCGKICNVYFQRLQELANTEVVACADLIINRAKQKAEEWNVPKPCTVDDLLADKEVQIVVNLTIPKAHFQVAMAAVKAGKHVYNEKPLTVTREQGQKLLKAAKTKRVRVGGAPDTFLGAGIQTCRKLIGEGWIGKPIAATAFQAGHGHESWHPDPEFYYDLGGGPLFDMGPYYLTALVSLLGPVKRVAGSAKITFPVRTITSEKKHGKKIKVKTPTHIAGVLEFANGCIGTVINSFDVWTHSLPGIEIYGTEGSMKVPNPNGFGGTVFVRRATALDWSPIPLTHGYTENYRGLGVSEMAEAIANRKKRRANEDLTYHVLDIMHSIHDSSKLERHVTLKSTCQQPEPMPMVRSLGVLDRLGTLTKLAKDAGNAAKKEAKK